MAKPTGQERKRDLRRKPPFLSERPSILIVCEGQKTEPGYFCRLRSILRISSLKIVVDHEGSAPISVVNRAVELKKDCKQNKITLDAIYCVMDTECPCHPSLDQAIDKANGNQLDIILSNPCFEYWYVLHFERLGSYVTQDQAVQRLKRHYPQYVKGETRLFDILNKKIETAIRNAKDILQSQHHNETDLRQCNPATHVYRIVERMKEIEQIQ